MDRERAYRKFQSRHPYPRRKTQGGLLDPLNELRDHYDGYIFAEEGSRPYNPESLSAVGLNDRNPLPLMFQTGYLTIAAYKDDGLCGLRFPNREVEKGFYQQLLNNDDRGMEYQIEEIKV